VTALAIATCPIVVTHHASGDLNWSRWGMRCWGFLMRRVDYRIAVSEQARRSAERWTPGDYEVIPNGVLIPETAEPGSREHTVVFAGRHEPRKGLHVLLRSWPEIRAATGATLKICGADPLAVRLLLTRLRVPDDGIEILGFLPQEAFTELLCSTKALVAPSLGGESFGMVLTRAFACALPVVASDITGYRDVMTPETGVTVPPEQPRALAAAVIGLLADEPRRVEMAVAARALAQERYAWPDIARRLLEIYEAVAA
jgi:phosphatidylinositol alpha-mannosyltransferase